MGLRGKRNGPLDRFDLLPGYSPNMALLPGASLYNETYPLTSYAELKYTLVTLS